MCIHIRFAFHILNYLKLIIETLKQIWCKHLMGFLIYHKFMRKNIAKAERIRKYCSFFSFLNWNIIGLGLSCTQIWNTPSLCLLRLLICLMFALEPGVLWSNENVSFGGPRWICPSSIRVQIREEFLTHRESHWIYWLK